MSKEIEALIDVLSIYSETNEPVSQQFYQGLCLQAKEALILLREAPEQPPASEFTKKLREEISELLPLPDSNQLKCSQCGGLVEYNTALTYDAQSHCEKQDGGQMMGIGWAGWLNMMRDFIWFEVPKLCERLDTSEASKADLLEALEKYGDHEPCCTKGANCICGFEAAIAKNG